MRLRKPADMLAESDSLHAYLRAIGKFPRLTVEEERDLGRRIQDDQDDRAVQRLVEANLRFVVSYAKRYRNLGVSFLDLIHEGNLGLIEAARRFNPTRNVKFITYAVWWVRQAMVQALAGQSRAFSLPVKLSAVASHFGREVAALSAGMDHAPSTREIADDLDLSEGEVEALLRIVGDEVSLSDHLTWNDDASDGLEVEDVLEQASVPPAEEELIRHTLSERLRLALEELDEREQRVISMRYGLDDGETKTLQEIGARLHLTRERIRQIEARAKEKLRRSKKASELRSYLN